MNLPSQDHPDGDKPPGLFASLRQLGLTALSMAHTRVALAGVELEEELQRLIGLLLSLLGLLVFALVGILIGTSAVVLAVDPAQRVAVLAFFAVVYLGLAGWFWWRVQRMLATRPPFLQTTFAEMVHDRDALQAASSGDEPGDGGTHG